MDETSSVFGQEPLKEIDRNVVILLPSKFYEPVDCWV
jgi:hypothetical protein